MKSFYQEWQNRMLADDGGFVSKEYRHFQTALVKEIDAVAKKIGGMVVKSSKGHYYTSVFVQRGDKFVYISHSSGLKRNRPGLVQIDLDDLLMRTAKDDKDYHGGSNQYCCFKELKEYINRLLS